MIKKMLKKKVISASRTPAIAGKPYSPAIKMGHFVFTSGHVFRDAINAPDDIDIDIKTQTRITMELIKSLIEAAGATMDNIIKCNVYLTNIDDFDLMNKVYLKFFKNEPPARTTIQVSKLVFDCAVEIEAIAFIP